jgi:HEAT repeat protein
MIRLLQQPVEVAPVIAAIWDREPSIRVDATETLAVIGWWLDWSSPRMQHIVHALKIALRHHTPDVRRAAALGLARLSAYEATEALAARLEVEQEPDVRQAVALALGALSDAGAVFPLLDSYEAEEITRDVCYEALLALGRRAVEPLIGVVRRWNVRVVSRQIAAEALGELGDPAAVEPLTVILGRPHEPLDIRTAAAISLGKLGSRSALPMLAWVRREWGLEAALRRVVEETITRIEGQV